jgi:hypothetical protein
MSDVYRSHWIAPIAGGLVILVALSQACTADPFAPRRPAQSRPSQVKQLSAESPIVAADHPMALAVNTLNKELEFLRASVHDFRCRVTKRERVNGLLQDYFYIDMWVREEIRTGSQVTSPLSVYMQFVGPSEFEGRRVLFVEGRNEGKILARKGGDRFEYVVTKIDPNGENAKSESLLPITQSGFTPMLVALVAGLEKQAAADPSGTNTHVERIDGAKLDGRPCYALRITHPQKQDDLEFHTATIFIDSELHVPARIEKSDWPASADQTPALIAEYNYTDIQVNIGLKEQMFDPRLLRKKR